MQINEIFMKKACFVLLFFEKCQFLLPDRCSLSVKTYLCKTILKIMLTLDQLRKDTVFVKERLMHKNFKETPLIDEIIALDDSRKSTKTALDDLLAQRNSLSREIGVLMKEGEKEAAELLKNKIAI